ncbi:hypothetical protein JZ751_010024 [Albula glossodonta]|uniref:Uncharacterized protein n=1 Tax=Albula glossodonta TaxID=121402 RepID=A0A8T2N199_9TELE|nr:hypothetical protein JZ751_010024 [Albula glossodonta]
MGTMGAPLRGLVALEAKLDILGRKLDSLLSNPRPAGCPHCSACGLHAGQQEAVVSMLTAQAQRLDALERLVLGMTQDGGATPNCVGGATPTHRGGATPDHKGGTTPNRVGGATSNPDAGATPTHKGEAAPNREGGATLSCQGGATPNREGATPEKSLFFRAPSPAKSPFGAAKEGIVKRTQPLKQQNVFVALQKGVPAQVKDEAKKDKAESLIKPLSPPLAGESEPKGITAAPSAPPMPSLSSKGSPHKAAPPKPEPAGHKPPLQTGEGKGAVRDDRGDSSKTTANPGVGVAKEQQAGIGQSGAPSPLQLPGQGVAKATLPTPPPPPPPPPSPDMLAVTPPTTGGKATFSLAPNKLLGVMVPTATTDSPTLRHVHSCPVSLQRIQDSEGSLQPKPPSSVAPPLGKRGSIAAVAPVTAVKPSVAAGIQIKVSPAPDITAAQGTPKSSPIVCHKILDTTLNTARARLVCVSPLRLLRLGQVQVESGAFARGHQSRFINPWGMRDDLPSSSANPLTGGLSAARQAQNGNPFDGSAARDYDDPPRPAPFPHHVVSLRPSQPCDSYIINTREVLGG